MVELAPVATGEWRHTVSLPRTDFPMKANLPQLEVRLLESWRSSGLRARVQAVAAERAASTYVLHDGPPYANGSIHHGHALNKVLKDITARWRTMAGQRVNLVPGWDCHGLPIELNVERRLSAAEKQALSRREIRTRCRAEAEQWIAVQSAEFQRLGVWAQWEAPYRTMDPAYEAAVVRELARFADGRGLYRGVKPVHWCWHCRTALAEAELTYRPTTAPSAYVLFPVTDPATLSALHPSLAGQRVAFAAWTTTPWTIPANRGLALGGDAFDYTCFRVEGSDWRIIVAGPLRARVEQTTGHRLHDGVKVDVASVCSREGTVKPCVDHPLIRAGDGPLRVPVLVSEHVTADQGSGVVHVAPGHGPEDFVMAQRLGLDVVTPVGVDGRFLPGVDVAELVGLHVLGEGADSGQARVLDLLDAAGLLLSSRGATVEHDDAHCWRCKNTLIFRATEQWFISMDATGLRRAALEALEQVTWVPAWGVHRIRGMLEDRPDWCISRQRAWGVPIPVFSCRACGQGLASAAVMQHVADVFAREGSDAWWDRAPADLLPAGTRCGGCGGQDLVPGEDILDVWFESGASFAAVCAAGTHEGLHVPADLYLEGSDQHRGWFHSSLLVGVGGRGTVPYRSVLTHGFVVDAQGLKYSKSHADQVPAMQLVEQSGAELLRLWVASTDHSGDARLGTEVLERLSETYRKIRNTLRFMLANIHGDDFQPAIHAVPPENLAPLDRYVLARFSDLVTRVRAAYENNAFHAVIHGVTDYLAVELSAQYLDIQKNILYCDPPGSARRRSAQTTMYQLCRGVLSLLAPVLVFTTEEAWSHLPPDPERPSSVHLSGLPTAAAGYAREDAVNIRATFDRLYAVRGAVQRVLEPFRAAGHNTLAARVSLSCPFELRDFLQGFLDDLPEFFIVSAVELLEQTRDPAFVDVEIPGLRVRVDQAPGARCGRCWTHHVQVGAHAAQPDLCPRCVAAVPAFAGRPA